VEGKRTGEWILLDYLDFVVHVFTPETRSYYGLERLWGDAPRLAASVAERRSTRRSPSATA
jgi:ribosome-associated protein